MDIEVRNLSVPGRVVDVILDTDTYNEIDDQVCFGVYVAVTGEDQTGRHLRRTVFE